MSAAESVPPPASLRALLGDSPATIGGAFRARAALSPRQTFLFWQSESWTYREAEQLIERLAEGLSGCIDPDRPRVASYLSNCPEAMWVWLASAFEGLVHVPLNRKHRGDLLADMLTRSCASVLVTDVAGLVEVAAQLPDVVRTIVLIDDGDPPQSVRTRCIAFDRLLEAARIVPWRVRSSDLACVMYTSGTTGRSKAVALSHNQYVRSAARLVDAYGLASSDVFHNWLPLCHVAGQCHMTMTAVLSGGAVALLPTFSTSAFRDEVERYRCTVLCGFASILHFIWSLPERDDDASLPLRMGIFAGIPAELHRPFEQRFGMSLGENYGMTEIDPVTCPIPGRPAPLGSCGFASPDVEIAIVDDAGHAVARDSVGRIAIRPRVADIMMAGYEGDEAATRAAFLGDWFVTGDYGSLDATDALYFRGRASHFIRRRGENVSVSELESIMQRHEAVIECAAVGVPSDVGEEEIKIAVVLREGAVVTPAELHRFATERMATFMVPRFVEVMPALPRGDLGKVELGTIRRSSQATWDARGMA